MSANPEPVADFICHPKSLFHWDSVIAGFGHQAEVIHSSFRERGEIMIDRQRFKIVKQGFFSGTWTMMQDENDVAVGYKSGILSQRFEVRDHLGTHELRARSIFSRAYELKRDGRLVAAFKPAHILTRRTRIEVFTPEYQFETLAFCYWLITLIWRRNASND